MPPSPGFHIVSLKRDVYFPVSDHSLGLHCMTSLTAHCRVVCLDFPADLLRFWGPLKGDLRGSVLLWSARKAQWLQRERWAEEWVQGGNCGKGALEIWSSSDVGCGAAGRWREGICRQGVITIEFNSRRKWPSIAPITVITADITLNRETWDHFQYVYMHIKTSIKPRSRQ